MEDTLEKVKGEILVKIKEELARGNYEEVQRLAQAYNTLDIRPVGGLYE